MAELRTLIYQTADGLADGVVINLDHVLTVRPNDDGTAVVVRFVTGDEILLAGQSIKEVARALGSTLKEIGR